MDLTHELFHFYEHNFISRIDCVNYNSYKEYINQPHEIRAFLFECFCGSVDKNKIEKVLNNLNPRTRRLILKEKYLNINLS